MVSEDQIIDEIEEYVDSDHESWLIGITNNPKQRQDKHDSEGKDTSRWRHWYAGSEESARLIEDHFLDKGMRGGTGGGREDDPPTYVYVF